MQHSSHSLDYGSVDQLLPLLDDGLLVGQVAKKSSTRRPVSVLSSWMEAWNILHSDCAQTALELVKYQHIICQLFAPDGNLEVCKALLAGHSYAQAAYLGSSWLGSVEEGHAGVVCHTSALSCTATASSKHHTSRHYSIIWCTRSEPPTIQARRFASVTTLAGATRGQSAILLTGAGSQAVVESTLPRPGHVLHQWPRDLQRVHTTL